MSKYLTISVLLKFGTPNPDLVKLKRMSFFSRLFKINESSEQLTCPRCLGKGNMDNDDIVRLKQKGKWRPGVCIYCSGSGSIGIDMLGKAPEEGTYQTEEPAEDDGYNNWGSSFPMNEKREGCPVTEQNRLWLEEAFLLLQDFFGIENTRLRKVLIPDYNNFPVKYDGTAQSAYDTMEIVATQMEVAPDSIELDFYDDEDNQISGAGDIFLEADKDNKNAAGLYYGMNENGKYEIFLNTKQLLDPESLVATLAHEIAHIKLLGENRMDENNEYLTDLTTVIFGLGIFNANNAFRSFRGSNYYEWRSQGYLSQVQWGYSLALFAFIRDEVSPAWINYLTPNIKSDFLQGQQFIMDNKDLVFHM